jgi:hypothetical protein
MDELTMLEGCAPMVIDRRHKPSIIALRADIREQTDTFDETALRVFGGELAGLYVDIAERATMGMPKLQNTDGDPLESHTLVFDVRDRDAVVSALDTATLDGDETIWSDDHVAPDAEATESEARWTWSRAGNAMHKSWDNTTLGVLSLGEDKLRVEVNSARRAARARSMLGTLLGTHVTYRATSITSSEKLLEEARDRRSAIDDDAQQAKLMALPEVRERLTEMLMSHYRDWLDTKLPILRGRTPREAVGDRDGREAVEALVNDIERRSPGPGPELDPAIPAMLRRELGLD